MTEVLENKPGTKRPVKRTFTEKMRNKLNRINILSGGHEGRNERNAPAKDVQACVMEALAWVTGQRVTDAPVCASGVITHLMIEMNDLIESTRERNKLKKLIPDIMGTAPVAEFFENYYEPGVGEWTWGWVERKDTNNPAYQYAEAEREDIVAKWIEDHGGLAYNDIDSDAGIFAKLGNFEERFNLVREVAAVAKFNNED